METTDGRSRGLVFRHFMQSSIFWFLLLILPRMTFEIINEKVNQITERLIVFS